MKLAIVLALIACSSKNDAPAPAGSDKPIKPVGGPDGLPAGYVLPDGAKLVETKPPDWTYSVARPPDAVATELAGKLTKAGWTIALRHPKPDMPAVFASHDKPPIIVAVGMTNQAGTVLSLDVAENRPDMIAITPPSGYPAGFPFVPFAKLAPDDRKDRFRMIYSAPGSEIEAELMKLADAAGWACHGSTSTLSACRKGGAEVTVTIRPLDDTQVAMFVNIEKSL